MSILFAENPLVVNLSLAKLIGLNEAIVLQQMHYWLQRSRHVIDGNQWVYNSVRAWAEQFPFWSEATVKRLILKLERKGLLVSGNHNKDPRDQTKWYRINHDKLAKMTGEPAIAPLGQSAPMERVKVDQCVGSECTNASGQNDLTITRDYTETTSETTSNNTVVDGDSVREIFEFWKTTMGKNNATVLDANRRGRIEWALKHYSQEDARKAIVGCSVTPWNMGENPSGKKHNDLTLIFRSASHVERFIDYADRPPQSSTTPHRTGRPVTRHNDLNTPNPDDFVPDPDDPTGMTYLL